MAAEFDTLSEEVLERIRREQDEFSRAFATSAPQRLWEGAFVPPVSAEISSPFGYRRVINGTPRAPHTGTDLRVPMGTEVRAPNQGKVVLLGNFFFSGNSVILDHGGGLFTMYFHLSEFRVEEGATVGKGDVIGLSGMTGRVTGPHLHWGARLNNARIDPFELVGKLSGKSDERAARKRWSKYQRNKMAKKDQPGKKFEVALEELERVVEQLESGDLSLEEFIGGLRSRCRARKVLQSEIE